MSVLPPKKKELDDGRKIKIHHPRIFACTFDNLAEWCSTGVKGATGASGLSLISLFINEAKDQTVLLWILLFFVVFDICRCRSPWQFVGGCGVVGVLVAFIALTILEGIALSILFQSWSSESLALFHIGIAVASLFRLAAFVHIVYFAIKPSGYHAQKLPTEKPKTKKYDIVNEEKQKQLPQPKSLRVLFSIDADE